MIRLLVLALLPVLASAASTDRDALLTVPEYRRGLKELRGYFVKRNEDPAVADRYIANLENAFRLDVGQPVPVTRGVFDDFMKYQAAWTRKTRDSKNPNVPAAQLEKEKDRAVALKAAFKEEASQKAPQFYAAFQAAVRDVRAQRRAGAKDWSGNSNVFFAEQVDDSYTHVDAGNEALEKRDTAAAIKEAGLALASNPANADAFVLRAGAEYERGDTGAAVTDAQSALLLDPGNAQAQAILSLTATPSAARAAAAGAHAGSSNLDGRSAKLASDVVATDEPAAPALVLNPYGAAPSATPAVGKILSADMSVRAVKLALTNPRQSIDELGQAMTLDPRNSAAADWRATIANRNGDWQAALGSAQRVIAENPQDAHGYFNKAYALAGTGDKKGMLEALEKAASIDPAYQAPLKQAQTMSEEELFGDLFAKAADQHQPAAPQPGRSSAPASLWLLSSIGAMFLSAGAVLLWRSGAGRGPKLVRR